MKNERKGLFGFLSMEMPHTYLLIFTILIICALLTYVVPAGQFETAANETGRQVVTLYQFFNAIPTGLVSMASLIFFVMIAGGSFAIINETKTIDIVINKLIKALEGKEHLIIFVIMFLFSLLGGLIGLSASTRSASSSCRYA